MILTGVSLSLVMILWSPTQVFVWSLPLPNPFSDIISLAIFWSCLIYCGIIVERFGTSTFIGLKQLFMKEVPRSEGNQELCTTGIFAWVRHPIYFLTLIATFVSPKMTLDRLLLGVAMLLYLGVGIPIEEKKLVQIFGQAYRDYQKRVPALFPKFTYFWTWLK